MRIWIVTSHSERIVEDERSSLKTEAVCPQIRPVLIRIPSPTQQLILCGNYDIVVTSSGGVKARYRGSIQPFRYSLFPPMGTGRWWLRV